MLYQLSYTPTDGAAPPSLGSGYFVSRCRVCCRQRGQYLFSSSRPGSFRLFFRVLYVRSLQVVHASVITGRFSALATSGWSLFIHPDGHGTLRPVLYGESLVILGSRGRPVNARPRVPRPAAAHSCHLLLPGPRGQDPEPIPAPPSTR